MSELERRVAYLEETIRTFKTRLVRLGKVECSDCDRMRMVLVATKMGRKTLGLLCHACEKAGRNPPWQYVEYDSDRTCEFCGSEDTRLFVAADGLTIIDDPPDAETGRPG